MSSPKKKKKSSFWCVLLYATTTNHFSIGLWHETKSRLYTTMAMTSSVVGSRRSSNETSKAKFEPPQKKVMVTVWWTAAHLVHYSSLNPSESITSEKYTQQISEMHRKLEHLEPARVNRKGPILLHNNAWPHVSHASKVEQIGVQSFASSAIFNWPLANQLPQLFCRENASTTSKEAENAFLKFLKSWSTYLYATGINQLISHWQKCVDCNGSYFD